MPAKTFCTVLLPPPKASLSPRDALLWLQRDFQRWYGLCGYGFGTADADMRQALGSLALDLGTLVEACTTAIRERRSVAIELWLDARSFDRHTRELERVAEAEAWFRRHEITTGLKTRIGRALAARRRYAAQLAQTRE